MEQNVTWKAPGKIIFFVVSLLLLGGLLIAANLVNPSLHFADPNLEQAIRKKINQPNAPLSRLDVLPITELDASGLRITQLGGIEALRRLTKLNLAGNTITDLAPLAHLSMLSELNLAQNKISDLDALHIRTLTHLPLRSLNLRGNAIAQIAPLTEFRSLEKLNLRENNIQDVAPLKGLTNLINLNIHSNSVTNGLNDLAALTNLQTLTMRNVQIGENSAFLAHLTKLQRLNIRNTGMRDFSVLVELMEKGALQDNPAAGISASVNLLELAPVTKTDDPYQVLRRYWDNIAYPYPVDLPYLSTAANAPVFSHLGGFYPESFSLTMTGDTPIYYTLNGAEPAFTPQLEPTGSTRLYNGPILIQNRAQAPNLLANIITDNWRKHTPPGPIFKGTVVRAVMLDASGKRSKVQTQSYFVDPSMVTRYSLPIVSLVTDAKNLFDDELGIYAFGNLYKNIDPDNPLRNPANYTQHGLKWERPAAFEMFSAQGQPLLAQNIGIRINGGFSRAYSPKALRLYAGSQYDAQTVFQYNFFPALNKRLHPGTVVDTFDGLILRNAGNDVRTIFRDALAHSVLASTQMDIKANYPVIVFINGEYWGIHDIRNKYDEAYFQQHYGIAPNDLLVFERSTDTLFLGTNSPTANNFSNLYRIIDPAYAKNDFATTNSLADNDLYQQISDRVDIDNFILHYVTQIYIDNTDWPKTNTLTWLKKTDLNNAKNAPYGQDGKLRWMNVDIDLSFTHPEHNNLTRLLNDLYNEPSTYLLRSLLQNEGFRRSFINQFADQINSTFREQVVISKVDQFEALYAPEIEDHIDRWGLPAKSLDAWRENVDVIRQFATLRPAHQRQQIVAYFHLPGTATVTLQTDSAQGSIRINSLTIQKDTAGVTNPNNWRGVYFQGIPIEVTAIPAPGYQFAGWVETGSSTAKLTVTLTKDTTLTARFVKTE